MTPEQVLALKPKILSAKQRESYFANGYLIVEKIIPEDLIARLRRTTDEMVEQTRTIAKSDKVWDLDAGHSPEKPRLRRLSSPNDQHPAYWEYASQSIVPDIVADLVGPDVKFHHSKLNFKSSKGGAEVKWHQDISFWPHTNYSPLTVGTYLYDCGMEQGPVGFLPGSHKWKIYDQYDPSGNWTGCLSAEDLARIDLAKAAWAAGPSGSITIHNCRTLHGSAANMSDLERPLLLNVYSSADALPYTPNPLYSKYDQTIVRGQRARWSHMDPEACLVPPDWAGGYQSIFAYQLDGKKSAAAE